MTKTTLMMQVFKRLKAEGRWTKEAEAIRNEIASRAKGLRLTGIHAQNYTYQELARKFPPLDGTEPETELAEEPAKDEKTAKQTKAKQEVGDASIFPTVNGGVGKVSPDSEFSVTGLSEIPANWELPSNASLAAEVSWVQANRLRVVRETSDRVIVDLSRALSPAPSYAALGWLETSIKTYSKFVDVAARATSGQDSEAADIRREIQSIEEVRKLLASML